MFILKGFKPCVLEVRILNELWARFAEVRILLDLVASEPSEFGVIERRATRAEKSENRFQVQEVAHPLCDGKRSESLERKGVACVAVCRACTDRCWRGRGLFLTQTSHREQENKTEWIEAAGQAVGFASGT